MKQKSQNKKTSRAVNKPIATKRVKKTVKLIHADRPGLKHFRLVEHKYTFKLIHHRHTSHSLLMLILVFIGFFMYASQVIVGATTSSQSILVGAIVPGPPPSKGASITNPKAGEKLIGNPITDISGICEAGTFVVVQDNGLTIGSINCDNQGRFNLQAQLQYGQNNLTALNYDNMNQVGPSTPVVVVILREADTEIPTPQEIIPTNVLQAVPDNPSIITGVSKLNDCVDYNPGELPTGGPVHVSIVCVPRLFFPGMKHQLGIIVWGGQPPYALSINWGKENIDESKEQSSESEEDTLISIEKPGYQLVNFNYVIPDTYRVTMRLNDKKGEEAVIQTAVQVNGQTGTTTTTTFVNEVTSGSWLKTPVPFYILAVGITLGFWGGDFFDRKFGAHKTNKIKPRKHRTA